MRPDSFHERWKSSSLEEFPREQAAINAWIVRARGSPELERMALARELLRHFQTEGLRWEILPVIPSRDDFWFLEQLLSMDRLVGEFPFDVGAAETVRVTSSADGWVILDALAMELGVPAARSRREADALLATGGPRLVEWLGLSKPPRVLSLLRVSSQLRLPDAAIESGVVHLAGFRRREDLSVTGLIGGHPRFGGRQHIDSLRLDQATRRVGARLELAL